MIALAIALIALQTAPEITSTQQPDRKVVVDRLPKGADWKTKSAQARRLHAEASVQALKLNPFFGGCSQLTAEAFERAFSAEVDKSPDSPTITDAALAAYAVCPTGGQ